MLGEPAVGFIDEVMLLGARVAKLFSFKIVFCCSASLFGCGEYRVSELAAKLATLKEQAAEASAMGASAAADVTRLKDTLPYLSERVDRRRTLVDKGRSEEHTSELQSLMRIS